MGFDTIEINLVCIFTDVFFEQIMVAATVKQSWRGDLHILARCDYEILENRN